MGMTLVELSRLGLVVPEIVSETPTMQTGPEMPGRGRLHIQLGL
jgi:hypothetical protein